MHSVCVFGDVLAVDVSVTRVYGIVIADADIVWVWGRVHGGVHIGVTVKGSALLTRVCILIYTYLFSRFNVNRR